MNETETAWPTHQATYMKGEINFTVRGHEPGAVLRDLKSMVKDWSGWTGSQGTQSAQAPVSSDVKCKKCGSATNYKTINTKNGPTGAYQCTNPTCKNDRGYSTTTWESEAHK